MRVAFRGPAYLGLGLVYAWRWTFGLFTRPGTCKYHPTCSQYALDALREYGLIRGSVREVRHSDIDLRHTGMQPLKRLRIVGRWNLLTCLFVVGPERDHEPVPLIDTRFHSGLKARHGGLDLSKPSSNLNFSLERLKSGERHSGNEVAGQQAQSEFVRIVKNPRVGGCQIQP